MASTTIKFRASSVSGKQGTLFIQVIHQRVARRVSTNYKLYPEEWDATTQMVALSGKHRPERSHYLRAVQQALHRDAARLQLIILALDQSRKPYHANEVVARFMKREPSDDFPQFAESVIQRKREEGQRSLATKYRAALNSLCRFLEGRPLSFEDMDAALMLSYETHLRNRGLCPNTTSFYMRNLRAIYNQAVRQGVTTQSHPFARVYTGVAKTVKRALSAREFQRIRAAELAPNSAAELSRDIFLFIFYACGMSLIDIANLKKTDLQGDYLTYCRQKTGQQIRIHWEPCMQQLVNKYQRTDSPYLFPLIATPGADEARQYQNRIHLINHYLKRLGQRLGLSSKLTSYVARHSWASIAKSQNVPVAAISEAMGHTSERTTRIYLKWFDNTQVDLANQKVLNAIA